MQKSLPQQSQVKKERVGLWNECPVREWEQLMDETVCLPWWEHGSHRRTVKDELEAQRPDHEDMCKTPSTVCMEEK